MAIEPQPHARPLVEVDRAELLSMIRQDEAWIRGMQLGYSRALANCERADADHLSTIENARKEIKEARAVISASPTLRMNGGEG